ncbi:Hypothetical_protein [Hexamita inflata]|uniref:Hypothetical_protein n=1 Tax=Hexamita inflata TaxID=28002 RepID=A0AA86PP16_9EUKA|nr:Hypothetical protein HINF_LOCUS28418 [Hexamita inflata]
MNCVVAYFDDKLGPRVVFSSIPDDYNNFNLAYCLLPPGCHFCTEDSFFTSYEGNFYYAQLFQIPSDAQRPLRTYSVSISSPLFEKVLHFSVKVTELALTLENYLLRSNCDHQNIHVNPISIQSLSYSVCAITTPFLADQFSLIKLLLLSKHKVLILIKNPLSKIMHEAVSIFLQSSVSKHQITFFGLVGVLNKISQPGLAVSVDQSVIQSFDFVFTEENIRLQRVKTNIYCKRGEEKTFKTLQNGKCKQNAENFWAENNKTLNDVVFGNGTVFSPRIDAFLKKRWE